MNEVLKGDEVNSSIYEQELQKTVEYVFRVENVLYMDNGIVVVKCKGFYGSLILDKVLPDKIFDIAKNPKYDGYERGMYQ